MVPDRPSPPPLGARLATVTAVSPAGPYVEVDGLAAGYDYGPAYVTATAAARTTGAAGDPTHSHTVTAALTVGDRVLVVFLGSSRTELAIVDRILPGT